MKLNFYELFQQNTDGSISPLKTIQIGPVIIGAAMRVMRGVKFGGIDLFELVGKEIDAEERGGIIIIKGFYG